MNIRTKLPVIARTLLGLTFVVFGLNGFLQFLPMPPFEGDAAAFMGGLAAAGYFFPLLKSLEIAAGLLLVSGRFVPLALLWLAPIVVNIVAFHAFLAGGLGLPLVLLGLGLYLAWAYRDSFRSVLDPRAKPALNADRDAVEPVAHTA